MFLTVTQTTIPASSLSYEPKKPIDKTLPTKTNGTEAFYRHLKTLFRSNNSTIFIFSDNLNFCCLKLALKSTLDKNYFPKKKLKILNQHWHNDQQGKYSRFRCTKIVRCKYSPQDL